MVNKPPGLGRRLSTEARREHLVSVGVELIATRPWDGLTMNDIAAAAEVSKPLLYHYFADKRDLYLAAVESAAVQLREATLPDTALPPQARPRRALEVHVDWVEANALAYRAIMQGGISADPDVQKIVEASRAETVRRIVSSMEMEQPPPALRIALRGWIGFLEAACLDWLASRDLPRERLVNLLAASLRGAIKDALR
jgi:AcrR family transcriptional regulator